MTTQVRVGVIGTNWWADMMHLPALKSHPQAKLVAIRGRNQEHLNARHGGAERYLLAAGVAPADVERLHRRVKE